MPEFSRRFIISIVQGLLKINEIVFWSFEFYVTWRLNPQKRYVCQSVQKSGRSKGNIWKVRYGTDWNLVDLIKSISKKPKNAELLKLCEIWTLPSAIVGE